MYCSAVPRTFEELLQQNKYFLFKCIRKYSKIPSSNLHHLVVVFILNVNIGHFANLQPLEIHLSLKKIKQGLGNQLVDLDISPIQYDTLVEFVETIPSGIRCVVAPNALTVKLLLSHFFGYSNAKQSGFADMTPYFFISLSLFWGVTTQLRFPGSSLPYNAKLCWKLLVGLSAQISLAITSRWWRVWSSWTKKQTFRQQW